MPKLQASTAPCSRINACFRYPWCGLLLGCEKKKKISEKYILYYKGLRLFLSCCSTKYGPTWATRHVAGAGANWSIVSPCSQHIDLPARISLARVFIDAFTLRRLHCPSHFTVLPTSLSFPRELLGFATPVQLLEQFTPVWVSGSLAFER